MNKTDELIILLNEIYKNIIKLKQNFDEELYTDTFNKLLKLNDEFIEKRIVPSDIYYKIICFRDYCNLFIASLKTNPKEK